MEKQIYSPGFLSQMLQVDPRELQSALDQAGYRPELVIDGVAHWGADALVYLRQHARRLRGRKEGAK